MDGVEIIEMFKSVFWIPSSRKLIIGHYIVKFLRIFMTIIYIFFESFLFFHEFNPYAEKYRKICFIFNILILFLIIMSYIMTLYEGPGYLPFYYDFENQHNFENHDLKINNFQKLTGIALSTEEINFALNHSPANDVYYIYSEGRFVIRASNFDDSTGIYIGKRNIKFYLLVRLYSFLFTTITTISYFQSLDKNIYFHGFGARFAFHLISILILITFSYANIGTAVGTLNHLMFNVTPYESSRLSNEFVKSKMSSNFIILNLKEFFGDNLLLWFLPFPSFGKVTDEFLYIYSR